MKTEAKIGILKITYNELTLDILNELMWEWKKQYNNAWYLPTHLILGNAAFRGIEINISASANTQLFDWRNLTLQIQDCRLQLLIIDSFDEKEMIRCELIRIKPKT